MCSASSTSGSNLNLNENESSHLKIEGTNPLSINSSRSSSFSSPNDDIGESTTEFKPSISKESAEEYSLPIAGYEIIEERARFTVFKINVICKKTNRSWTVYRRYSDFSRLKKKLGKHFPYLQFNLPSKRWFGDNFDPSFLDTRVSGLQIFINQIMNCKQVYLSSYVRKFFCLDDPPPQIPGLASSNSFDALEKIIELQLLLKERDDEIISLKAEIATLKHQMGYYTVVKSDSQEQIPSTGKDSSDFHEINIKDKDDL